MKKYIVLLNTASENNNLGEFGTLTEAESAFAEKARMFDGCEPYDSMDSTGQWVYLSIEEAQFDEDGELEGTEEVERSQTHYRKDIL